MKYFFLFVCIYLFWSCTREETNIDYKIYEPKVVVEGSIENGKPATVLLTLSASLDDLKDSLSLIKQVIISAKVTVSEGNRSEILTLQTNKDKIPPFEYVGNSIIGEPGKTYDLRIEYANNVITSQTYLPEPISLNNIWYKIDEKRDSVAYIHLSFDNTSNDFYLISTRYKEQKLFIPCLYGNIDPTLYPENETISMQINKGPVIFPDTDYRTYFVAPSEVEIKFSTQTKEAYEFWTSYENEILNAQNPIFPANTSLRSNIKGGIGIWAGYGTSYYKIAIK